MNSVYSTLARVPLFKDLRREVIELERLGGGLTNVSYKVTTGGGAYVLRVAGKGTADYVDRAAEAHNAWIAAAAGVNVEVLYFDANDGTMVTRFVEGTATDGGERIRRDPGAPVRIALALKRVHGMGSVFESRFDVFAMIDGYLDLLRRLRAPLAEGCRDLERGMRAVRRALETSPAPLAPCHNDPWPGNLLEADGHIFIIDWEYSGMNDPMWDLGDLSVEAEFGPEQDRMMMEAYYGTATSLALYSRLEIYKAMSDLHWALWGFIQHAKGNLADDFRAYALGRLERYKARTSSADFGRHVGIVRAGSRRRVPGRVYRPSPERRIPV